MSTTTQTAPAWAPLPLPGFDFGDRTPEQRTITERFWRFHAAHPAVYRELVRLARQLRERGHRRYGIGSLFEVLRWHSALGDADAVADYRLDNNHRSRYARLIEAQEADLAGFFACRRLHGDFDLEGA